MGVGEVGMDEDVRAPRPGTLDVGIPVSCLNGDGDSDAIRAELDGRVRAR
jgi:hypothetical protein